MHKQNHYCRRVFFWVLLIPATTDSPTNLPLTQQLAESLIVFDRFDNKHVHFAEHKHVWENV